MIADGSRAQDNLCMWGLLSEGPRERDTALGVIETLGPETLDPEMLHRTETRGRRWGTPAREPA